MDYPPRIMLDFNSLTENPSDMATLEVTGFTEPIEFHIPLETTSESFVYASTTLSLYVYKFLFVDASI